MFELLTFKMYYFIDMEGRNGGIQGVRRREPERDRERFTPSTGLLLKCLT